MQIRRIAMSAALAALITISMTVLSRPLNHLQLTNSCKPNQNCKAVTVKTPSKTLTPLPTPGHPGVGGGGSSVVCSKGGLSINTQLNNNTLTINYSGISVGASESQVLATWNAYKNCVTTSPTKADIICTTIHDAHHNLAICRISLRIIPIEWGTPGGGGGGPPGTLVSGAIAQCTADLSNPVVYVPKPSIASMQFYPQRNWLLNLPVEYKYTDGSTPQPSLQGQLSAYCPVSIPSSSYRVSGSHPIVKGYKYLYTSITSGAYGSVTLNAGGLSVDGVHKGKAQVAMALYANPNQLVASSPACPHSSTLIPPSQLPSNQGNLAAYASLYQSRQICTVTPTSQNFQSVAFNKQAIMFELNQTWTFDVSYSITGSVSTNYYGSQVAYYSGKNGETTRLISSYNTPSTTPYGPQSYFKSMNVQANEYKSGPIAVNYVVGRECSVVGTTVTCPTF